MGLRDRVTYPSIPTISMLAKRTTKLVCEIYVPNTSTAVRVRGTQAPPSTPAGPATLLSSGSLTAWAAHSRTSWGRCVIWSRVERTNREQRTCLQSTGQQQKRCNACTDAIPRLFSALLVRQIVARCPRRFRLDLGSMFRYGMTSMVVCHLVVRDHPVEAFASAWAVCAFSPSQRSVSAAAATPTPKVRWAATPRRCVASG